jgi:hypothetical protein
MNTVLISILKKKKYYAAMPFFEYSRNEKLSPCQHIAFYPGMAYRIKPFGDPNK